MQSLCYEYQFSFILKIELIAVKILHLDLFGIRESEENYRKS